jgi:CxxC motif-containing protein (DUF1111 family)
MCRRVFRSLRAWTVAASVIGLLIGVAFGYGPGDASAADAIKADTSQDLPNSQVQRGRTLFLKRWMNADVASPLGDGLGPVFNARSCAECHNQTRPGGAGSLEHNVDLLSVFPPNIRPPDRAGFAARMTAIDPTFTANGRSVLPNVTLHKFGTDPAYGQWRQSVLDLVAKTKPGSTRLERSGRDGDARQAIKLSALDGFKTSSAGDKKRAAGDRGASKSDRVLLAITQRSTPALFGAGLIDEIPDEVLRATAKAEADRQNEISGQVAVAIGGRPGKFGWRGQTATLKEFVMGACANELGLEVPSHNQGINPLDPSYRAPGLDLTQEQCDDLAAFVANLPRPMQRTPKTVKERLEWQAGEHVFETIGCAGCHVRTLGTVEGLYSDLLLHDLGPKLADPASANPPASAATSAYYGGPADVFVQTPPITRRQWRTPPLWGVADSGPYLHDGRAATLAEAIEAHDGEAAQSARRFKALWDSDRDKLLAFLGSLAAPMETTRLAPD